MIFEQQRMHHHVLLATAVKVMNDYQTSIISMLLQQYLVLAADTV